MKTFTEIEKLKKDIEIKEDILREELYKIILDTIKDIYSTVTIKINKDNIEVILSKDLYNTSNKYIIFKSKKIYDYMRVPEEHTHLIFNAIKHLL
jgi:hypothetical protein